MDIPEDLKTQVSVLTDKYARPGIAVGYGIPTFISNGTADDLSIIFYVKGPMQRREVEEEIGDTFESWPVYYIEIGEIQCGPAS